MLLRTFSGLLRLSSLSFLLILLSLLISQPSLALSTGTNGISVKKSSMTTLKHQIAQAPPPTKFKLESPRGAKLATRVWPAKNRSKPKALCLIVHGGGWNSGYFEDLTAELTNKGIFCAAFDQVSCGYSDVEPGTPRPGVTHVDSFNCYVEDVFEAIKWMKKEAAEETENVEELPFYLIGESFGGLQVIDAAFQAKDKGVILDGVVSMGGLLELAPIHLPPSPVVSILVFLSKYFPKFVMPATNFEDTYDEAFGDPEWARTTRQDPTIKVSFQPTIGAVAAIMATGSRLQPMAPDFPVPFLAVHGKRDVRTSVDAMIKFVDNIGRDKASIELIETDGHQLLQDMPNVTKDVIDKVSDWIVKQVDNKK